MTDHFGAFCLSTSAARERLAHIITTVQDPRSFCMLTRHGKPVAAVVSIAELKRIWEQQDIEDLVQHGRQPSRFMLGTQGHLTNREAAEAIQKVQMDRRMEREVLEAAGLQTIPGGEIVAETDSPDQEAPKTVETTPSSWAKIKALIGRANAE